jgi:glycosyltransferase involved in cell wall biosynthesis
MRVTHLITGLCTGGAEMMLLRLLSKTDRACSHSDVISMMDVGPTGEKIKNLGVPVCALGMRRDPPDPLAFPRLVRRLRTDPPDVLATWMYHANFLGALAAPLAGGIPVVWGLHHGHLDPAVERRRTLWIARACGWMSHRLAAAIICCSESSRQEHLRFGYAAAKMEVIRNGFDLTMFRPDVEARHALRRELNIREDAPVVCLVARYHPEKDHRNFLEAAAILRHCVPGVQLLLCGHDVTWQNRVLASWIDNAGLRNCCHLLGQRDDVARIFNASDLACSASLCEAFSLVIGEAMCCGVPCVVTDVGDSAVLVGDTGLVVPARDPQALAEGCARLLAQPVPERRRLGERARQRVADNFELSQMVERYNAIFQRVVAARSRGPVTARGLSKIGADRQARPAAGRGVLP